MLYVALSPIGKAKTVRTIYSIIYEVVSMGDSAGESIKRIAKQTKPFDYWNLQKIHIILD